MTINYTVRSYQLAGAVALDPIHAKAEWDALVCLLGQLYGTARAQLFAVRLVVLLHRRLACSQQKPNQGNR